MWSSRSQRVTLRLTNYVDKGFHTRIDLFIVQSFPNPNFLIVTL